MATMKKSVPAKKPAKAPAKQAVASKKLAPAAKKPAPKPVAKKAAPAAKKPAPAKKAAPAKAPAKKPAPAAKKPAPAKPAAKAPAKKAPPRKVAKANKAGWPPLVGVKNNPIDVSTDRMATLPAREGVLSDAELAEFTESLLKELERQNKNCAALLRDNLKREESENLYATHMADLGSETFDQAINLLLASGRQENIREILEALRRLKNGTFGQCVACGKAINLERLKAHPQARLCIECQSASEKGKLIYKQVGRSIAEEGDSRGEDDE